MNVIVFDMDGTLIKESSWELLHDYFHAPADKVTQNREAYFSRRIDYETWMEKDILLWDSPTIENVRKALASYTLEPFTEAVIQKVKSAGITPCIVSSGIDILANMVGDRLGIEKTLIFANALVNINGHLKGMLRVEPYHKDVVVRHISHTLGIPLSEFAAVGDADPDISLFSEVALKFAYNPKDDLIAKAADYVLEDLRDLLDFCR